MTTLITARGSVSSTTQNTIAYEEVALGGVDLSSRKIPVIHRIELVVFPNDAPTTMQYFRGGIATSDEVSSVHVSDDEILAAAQVSSKEESAAFVLAMPYVFEFSVPIAVARSSIYIVASSSDATIDTNVRARVFFEVKTVTSNTMVALLAG